jgi:starch-binding outer membrane protein, SusD/RagB family
VVRRRAYGYDPFTPSPADYPGGMSISDFRNAVILERAYEFINEQQRWWDLLRTGTAKQAIGDAFGVTVSDARLLWPIPQEEINTNNAISQTDQNPGY